MTRRKSEVLFHRCLYLYLSPVARFSVVMFFEFLEDFNVIGAFDDSLSQITYQPAVERKLFLWMRDVELLHNFQQLLYGG